MSHLKYLFYFIFLHLILATPQLNLHYTDKASVNENNNNNGLQHNCLRFVSSTKQSSINRKLISYCLSELPSEFHLEQTYWFPNFTFDELAKQNISSQQLYLWSAPIDLIENYQSYLNQLSISNNSSPTTERFYNCTLPRFGPMCQYEFVYHYPNHSSLHEIIQDFYGTYKYDPTNLTCYTHLQCNRGPDPICLDWTEICNGRIDCLDNKMDEEHCWQLEINECKENEYRCTNGQCIPKSFYFDDVDAPDCLDGSDEGLGHGVIKKVKAGWCDAYEPSFGCDDMVCRQIFLTSSCSPKRGYLLSEVIFSIKDNSVSEKCWSIIKGSLNLPGSKKVPCNEFFMEHDCIEIIKSTCPDMLYFPYVPILFGDVYLVYRKSDKPNLSAFGLYLPYICHNNSRYDDYFVNVSMILFNNTRCFVPEMFQFQMIWSNSWIFSHYISVEQLYRGLMKYNPIINDTTALCAKPNMYQCLNSSICISIHRLMDTKLDCPHIDDENITVINNTDVFERMKQTLFKCQTTDKYISQILINNDLCNCGYIEDDWCEDEDLEMNIIRKNILFQTICDRFVELAPVIIDDRIETDETECQQWECNNIYTRCNGIWNCPNGADEAGCMSSSTLNCSSQHHLCVSLHANEFMCLPIAQANDGNVDCLGATDEPVLCQVKTTRIQQQNRFFCKNQISPVCVREYLLCDSDYNCEHGDDEQFCETNRTTIYSGICLDPALSSASDFERFFCESFNSKKKHELIYLLLNETIESVKDLKDEYYEEKVFSNSFSVEIFDRHQPRCHRGLDLRVWLNDQINSTKKTCLCPPSFYGSQCQYQNQRISLAIVFQALSDSYQTPLAIIISLIDDTYERIIHSYEHITYLSVKQCKTKFNIYLLYSTRPKNITNQYAIHIDFYEKQSLNYRGSVLLPIEFPFLPVNRLAFIVNIAQSVKMVVNVFLMMIILYPIKHLHVSVQEVIVEIDVKLLTINLSYHSTNRLFYHNQFLFTLSK